MFEYASKTVISNSQYLSELDMIGDADFGVNISTGFEKVLENLSKLKNPDIGTILKAAGDVFIFDIGATVGGLFGRSLQRAGRKAQGKNQISPEEFSAILDTMLATIKEIGGAKVGDKTMIDALEPAVNAAKIALQSGNDMPEILERVGKAADAGARGTAQMISNVGRSSYLGERSRGRIDPGAMFISIFLNCADKSLWFFLNGGYIHAANSVSAYSL